MSKLEGWVFGSMSIINRRPIYNSYTIFYRSLETEERGYLSIDPEQVVKMKLVPDFFDEEKAVHLFAFKKPQGKYEFYKISFFQNSGSIAYQKTFGSDEFSMPFTIGEKQNIYVGEIVLGAQDLTRPLEINDHYTRDIDSLKMKYPAMQWGDVVNETTTLN